MDEFTKKIEEQIAKNNDIIAEAKQTMEKMREFFKSMGADLDSGRNIFLESKELTDEGRKQAEEIIRKFEREFEEKYDEYRGNFQPLPGEKERPASLKKALEEDQRRYNEEQAAKVKKRGVRKMRL
jgi:hypothetical protein